MTIWKNVLERHGREMDPETVKELLKNKEIKDFKVIQPQTREKKVATLSLNKSGQVELLNIQAAPEE